MSTTSVRHAGEAEVGTGEQDGPPAAAPEGAAASVGRTGRSCGRLGSARGGAERRGRSVGGVGGETRRRRRRWGPSVMSAAWAGTAVTSADSVSGRSRRGSGPGGRPGPDSAHSRRSRASTSARVSGSASGGAAMLRTVSWACDGSKPAAARRVASSRVGSQRAQLDVGPGGQLEAAVAPAVATSASTPSWAPVSIRRAAGRARADRRPRRAAAARRGTRRRRTDVGRGTTADTTVAARPVRTLGS